MYDEDSPILNPFFTPEQWKLKTDAMLEMLHVSMTDDDKNMCGRLSFTIFKNVSVCGTRKSKGSG